MSKSDRTELPAISVRSITIYPQGSERHPRAECLTPCIRFAGDSRQGNSRAVYLYLDADKLKELRDEIDAALAKIGN